MRRNALVTPDLLVWGRRSVPVNVAAKRAGVTPSRLEEWERGDSQPTVRQARELARLYRIPFAALYLAAPPALRRQAPHDFRLLHRQHNSQGQYLIDLDVAEAWRRREVVVTLADEQGETLRSWSLRATLDEDPEDVGPRLRERLGLSAEAQSRLGEARRALGVWRSAVEEQGALVFQTSDLPDEGARAYSLSASVMPVVVLNRGDTPHGRVFSLLHEVAHIMLRESGICDMSSRDDRPPAEQRTEVFCNAVAAACLMPEFAFLSHPLVQGHVRGSDWEDDDLRRLSRVFTCSREAVLRRLLTFRLTTADFYAAKRAQYRGEYANRRRAAGAPPPHVDRLSILGRPFVARVLAAAGAQRITRTDAADYLGLRLKHFPALGAAMAGGE